MDLKTYFKVYFYITLCSIWTQGSLCNSTSFCLEVVDTNSNHTELQLCNTSSSDLVCGDNASIAIENTIFQCITNGSQGCGSCGNDAVPCSEEKPIYILHEIYSACSYKNNCSIPTTMYNLEGNITAVTIHVTYECVPDSDIFNICGNFNQTFNTNYQYLGKDGSSVDYDLCVCCITGLHSLSVKDFIIPYNDYPDCNSSNITLDGDILNCTEIINVDLQQRNASTIEIPGSNPYRLWLSIAACGEVEIKCSTVPTQQNATSTISSAGASFSNTVRPNTTDSTSSSTTTSSYGESSTTDNTSFNTETKNMTEKGRNEILKGMGFQTHGKQIFQILRMSPKAMRKYALQTLRF
ncbi:hypothetical protein MAR_017415 [Mya arenaria]|uniref:Sodefrin-like factor n=1 Tax=Mya arenaria TaxID=6604 RepID=A0ABY7EEU8_MYAAR|nr:hypothetical protein MAR_017415 [Mya arenaria]